MVCDQMRDEVRHEGKEEDSVFGGKTWNRRGGSKFWAWDPSQIPPLVANLDCSIKNILRSVFGLIALIVSKRVRESIFFQSNKFTACKIKAEKEVAKFLVVFNLHNVIHPSQGKKYLRT